MSAATPPKVIVSKAVTSQLLLTTFPLMDPITPKVKSVKKMDMKNWISFTKLEKYPIM